MPARGHDDRRREKVPATINHGGSEVIDAANHQRHALDTVARARSWRSMAEEHDLRTHKAAVADRAKVRRVGIVSAHFHLLELPNGVQRHFEGRTVPLDAEPLLRELSEASPRRPDPSTSSRGKLHK